jgi:hypothetical protein
MTPPALEKNKSVNKGNEDIRLFISGVFQLVHYPKNIYMQSTGLHNVLVASVI